MELVSEELLENFRSKHNVTEKDVEIALMALENWRRKQTHLPVRDGDLEILKRFLYAAKFSLERAKLVIQNYYLCRSTLPEFYSNRDPDSPEMVETLEQVQYFALQKPTKLGHYVHIVRPLQAEKTNPAIFKKYILMKADVELLLQGHRYLGDEMVFDMGNVPINIFLRFTPQLIKNFMFCSQDAIPNRTKRIHFINTPIYIETILSFFKMFLKQKLQDRFVLHSDMDSFHKDVSKDILPVEYGGTCGTSEELHKKWVGIIRDHKDYLMNESAEGSNEKLRKEAQKCTKNEIVSGMNGSFKKISLD